MFIKLKAKHIFLINFCIILALTVSSFWFWTGLESKAQEDDAIGIQIRTNPDKYSALRWYEEVKEFEGAPQELRVDGYEAIRDGRTVYVNAGNLSGASFHSNIYLLSYSQDSSPKTADVFAAMLKTWTFNTNLTNPGFCDIATETCRSDDDCRSGYTCTAERCEYDGGASLSCWRDRDCPSGIYCSSEKADVTRRTIRYAHLADIRTRIMDYVDNGGILPELQAGTYVPGISISTWPSWNKTLAFDVDGGEFPVDPLNVMGACASYDVDTCWNENTKNFAGGTATNHGGLEVTGPAGSSFYGYNTANVYSFSQDGIIRCPLDGSSCF